MRTETSLRSAMSAGPTLGSRGLGSKERDGDAFQETRITTKSRLISDYATMLVVTLSGVQVARSSKASATSAWSGMLPSRAMASETIS